MSTLAEFITENGITMTAKRADRNPNMDDASMDHWRCTLKAAAGTRLVTYFSMGSGHGGKEPTAEDVLDCLASDASGVENASSFEDWCSEYGYEPDSRKDHALFKVCEKQAAKLKAFLPEGYDTLLWETERL
jgi:hypothetical protein